MEGQGGQLLHGSLQLSQFSKERRQLAMQTYEGKPTMAGPEGSGQRHKQVPKPCRAHRLDKFKAEPG